MKGKPVSFGLFQDVVAFQVKVVGAEEAKEVIADLVQILLSWAVS
jgi:hypothetical protein